MIIIQESEVIKLLFGVGVLIYFFITKKKILELPHHNLLFFAYIIVFLGWVITVLEGLFYEQLLNLIEHSCYTASSLILCLWCYLVFIKDDAK
jgi:hypothetical protein